MNSTGAFLTAGFDLKGINFAAVFQGLDAHRLRVVPTTQSSGGPSTQEFVFGRSTKISALTWAQMPHLDKAQQMKKRKMTVAVSVEPADVVILGTAQGTVLVYSPTSNSILSTLKTGSTSPICAVRFSEGVNKLLSLQNDGTLTEIDLARNAILASSVVSVPDPSTLLNLPELIVANTSPHLYRSSTNDIEVTYTGFAAPIKQLLPLGKEYFAAISEEDRQALVYKLDSPKPIRSLMCPATNASHISSAPDLSALAITTEDGQVHVFGNPVQGYSSATSNAKSKRGKPVPQSKPNFSIEVTLAKRGTPLRVAQTRFSDSQLALAWPEQGSIPVFDAVSWRDTNGKIVDTDIKLEKDPSAPLAKEHLIGGVDPASAPNYQEADTRVISGNHVEDLSDEDEDGEDYGETLAERLEALEMEMDKRGNNGHELGSGQANAAGFTNGDALSAAGDDELARSDDQNSNSTSFSPGAQVNGEYRKSGEQQRQSRLRQKELKLKLSQPGSFATLLNRALTLKDRQLLEICLEERDATMIKTSIVKLEPALAASLLDHLASTMARAQNRSASLTQWIRWVIVIHGAYLVTLPNLLKSLAALHSTLSTRAATLPRLLSLQGRLELLREQLAIREEIAAAAAGDEEVEPEAYYDEEEATIVNGEEANDNVSDVEANLADSDSLGDSDIAENGTIMLSDED